MTISELQSLRQYVSSKTPLVLNLTNFVAMNISANALLAVGASPIMSSFPDEMEDLVAISSAVCVNIGCLDRQQIEAIRRAVTSAEKMEKPWVLDPVGVGASHDRKEFVKDLLKNHKPTIIRCNASEILEIYSLIGENNSYNVSNISRGVDVVPGLDNEQVVNAARCVALDLKTIVSVSGSIDYITDGEIVETVAFGSPLMPKVTAMGCTASAITAAFVGVFSEKPLDAAFAAMMTMGICGQKAAEMAEGPGSFEPLFIDQLYKL